LDLPWNIYYISWFHAYLAAMKIIFIGATATAIYYIYTKYRNTYNKEEDNFPFHWLIPPCFLLALVINQDFTFFEVG
jgi:ER lumen protein retaining receptor